MRKELEIHNFMSYSTGPESIYPEHAALCFNCTDGFEVDF